MNPSIDDRIGSVIRALSDVILPHLPAEAPLAQEQAQLAIGHLQIIRAQLDDAPAFERGELDDAIAVARALRAAIPEDGDTGTALAALQGALDAADGSDVRGQRHALNLAIEQLVQAVGRKGDPGIRETLSTIILDHEYHRAQKDRKWFAAFGFDKL